MIFVICMTLTQTYILNKNAISLLNTLCQIFTGAILFSLNKLSVIMGLEQQKQSLKMEIRSAT